MKGILLKAEIRVRKGSAESRRIRREEYIPAVLYGKGEEPLPIKVPKPEISKILHSRSGEHSIVELQIDEKNETQSILSVIKEVQHDPLTDLIIHADFERIQLGKPIVFTVPIEFLGTPVGVKVGGILTPHLHEIEIKCKPKDAPEIVEVDVSEIELGESIHIKDITIPNAEIINLPDETLVSVIKPRIVEEVEEKPEEEVEGEKGEGEEGESEESGEKKEAGKKAEAAKK